MFVCCCLQAQVATLTMTGDVEKDFGTKPGVITVADPGDLDVGLPVRIFRCIMNVFLKILPFFFKPGFAALGLTVSGWDMKVRHLYFFR